MKKQKMTVILLHYNQKKYVYEAIDSVLKQNYENIEFIINDDHSKDFEKEKIIKYIEKKQKGNIDLKINENKKNVGIVKSVNTCVKMATGDYITFFAADDALNNENVIKEYVNYFSKNKNTDVLCFQCLMYDINLKEIYYEFINEKTKQILKSKSKNKKFGYICTGCYLAIGATAFKTKILKNKPFDEEYEVVEDWPYYLSLLREGFKIKYHEYIALNHRDGGISHSENSPRLKKYRDDLVNIYKREIFPFFNKVKMIQRFKVLNSYNNLLNIHYSKPYDSSKNISFKVSKFLYENMNKPLRIIYNSYNFKRFMYLFLVSFLIKEIYKFELCLKLFFWIVALPFSIITIYNLFINFFLQLFNRKNGEKTRR